MTLRKPSDFSESLFPYPVLWEVERRESQVMSPQGSDSFTQPTPACPLEWGVSQPPYKRRRWRGSWETLETRELQDTDHLEHRRL